MKTLDIEYSTKCKFMDIPHAAMFIEEGGNVVYFKYSASTRRVDNGKVTYFKGRTSVYLINEVRLGHEAP